MDIFTILKHKTRLLGGLVVCAMSRILSPGASRRRMGSHVSGMGVADHLKRFFQQQFQLRIAAGHDLARR